MRRGELVSVWMRGWVGVLAHVQARMRVPNVGASVCACARVGRVGASASTHVCPTRVRAFARLRVCACVCARVHADVCVYPKHVAVTGHDRPLDPSRHVWVYMCMCEHLCE